MWPLVVVRVALFSAALAWPQQAAPQPGPATAAFPCDNDGVIHCSVDQVETVVGSRSIDDMRIIGKFIQLISERNRRYYVSWQTKAPSAAYELVKRVKAFPYLPYGDSYAITGLQIVLSQTRDRIVVRYPKKPKQTSATPLAEADLAIYETKLSGFIKGLEEEIAKLKKYEK